MKSSSLVLINVIVILLLIAGGGAAIYYYNQSVNYISTDNAKIDGQSASVAASSPGVLSSWTGKVGQSYPSGQIVGTVLSDKGTVNVTTPTAGTIVQQNAVVNSIVGAGSPLARVFDLDHLWVTANIKETKINDVALNQAVDIYVDAFPGTTLSGKVSQIGLATAGTFSLLPTTNTTGNYTKVTQVIPITVTIDGYKGLALVPGMSVSIRIHR
ncbi:HlyD family secretion protein [Cohnella candidum]|uniref:HlyD family secretion protein n=1 Tax=Cohnella candidum TaxID=2674991 RepID=A0A3G3K362_9BACL|nr:efflux RND transporter periplasmic adaptor subunit [Cohnella candidum]AYQ74810.1 HlyD family secretion protein [Cohnella candidum]